MSFELAAYVASSINENMGLPYLYWQHSWLARFTCIFLLKRTRKIAQMLLHMLVMHPNGTAVVVMPPNGVQHKTSAPTCPSERLLVVNLVFVYCSASLPKVPAIHLGGHQSSAKVTFSHANYIRSHILHPLKETLNKKWFEGVFLGRLS